MSGYPRPQTVRPCPVRELATVAGARSLAESSAARLSVPGDLAATGITHASGSVRPGDLYAALPGARWHGARFAPDAVAAGAIAVLTDPAGVDSAAGAGVPVLVVDDPRRVLGAVASRVYGEPSRHLEIAGITGTNGKTSTAYLVEAGLRAAGWRTGLIGTVETWIGNTRVDSVRTTPEATDLQALFATAVQDGVDGIVMEVSSHALALGRADGIRFAVGAFTNLGVDHLDFHADLDEYFAAKARLFDGRAAVEVVNIDDPAGAKLVKAGSTVTVSADGLPAADWRVTEVRVDGIRQHFRVVGPDRLELSGSIDLPGRHNVANALLALAILARMGVDPAVGAAAVAACPGVPGRMERVAPESPVLGIVDYAHKPDAVTAVLTALHEITPGRLICLIGAGGDRDTGKRPLMGAAAARTADLVLVTDDNPRTEDPAAIRAQVIEGARTGAAEVLDVPGRDEAIAAAVARAVPGDTVAVLGKGHEQGQELAGEVRPFDDRVVLAAALAGRFGTAS